MGEVPQALPLVVKDKDHFCGKQRWSLAILSFRCASKRTVFFVDAKIKCYNPRYQIKLNP